MKDQWQKGTLIPRNEKTILLDLKKQHNMEKETVRIKYLLFISKNTENIERQLSLGYPGALRSIKVDIEEGTQLRHHCWKNVAMFKEHNGNWISERLNSINNGACVFMGNGSVFK